MNDKLNRRAFIKGAGLATAGAAAAATTLATPAIAQGVTELKMVTSWPKNFPGLGTSAQRLADRITALSDGRIKVTVLAAGELVPAFGVHDAVEQGVADLYHAPDYYFTGKHAAFNYFTAAPLGLTFSEHTAWINFGGGQALWDELSGGFNVKPLLCGNTGTQMAGWFKREITGPEDLKGLNFRMPGLGAEVWRGLGMNVVNLPGGEIFPALEAGTIDGADWVGPWNDLAFGFYKVAPYYYYPSMVEGGAALCLGVNKGIWEGLSEADKALFSAAAAAENSWMYSDFTWNNGLALNALVNEHGVKLSAFPDSIIDEIGRIAPDVMASAATDDIGQRVLASYTAARETTRRWSSIAEPAYNAARQRILG